MPSKITDKAKRVWQRMNECYGARFAEQYGEFPTMPWIEVIEAASNQDLNLALANMRTAHLHHPPSLPEFQALIGAANKTSLANIEDPIRGYWRSLILMHVSRGLCYRDIWEFEPIVIRNSKLAAALLALLDELSNAEKVSGDRTGAMFKTCERRCLDIVNAFQIERCA